MLLLLLLVLLLLLLLQLMLLVLLTLMLLMLLMFHLRHLLQRVRRVARVARSRGAEMRGVSSVHVVRALCWSRLRGRRHLRGVEVRRRLRHAALGRGGGALTSGCGLTGLAVALPEILRQIGPMAASPHCRRSAGAASPRLSAHFSGTKCGLLRCGLRSSQPIQQQDLCALEKRI